MRAPKRSPIAFTVSDDVYVMETALLEPLPMRTASKRSSIASRRDDGPARVAAHAVVGDSQIWVSTERHGTFSFDTVSGAWSKADNWRRAHPRAQPLVRLLPHDDGHLCASNLTATPPSLCRTWRYRPSLLPHKGWLAPVVSYLVLLGGGRLCIAELFEMTRVEVGGRSVGANNKK
uniref:Uncharacterized protein n=1 Tax=Oryza punctata TaxID=4537 RepID=A0A0E0KZ33_ORYPU